MVETTTDALVGTLGGVMALGVMANVAGNMMNGGRRRRMDDDDHCHRRKECMRKKQEKNHPKKQVRRESTVRDSFW